LIKNNTSMVESTALNTISDKIELAEDLITLNDEFKKNVAIPYFKDIYKDLITQSDEQKKGINKVAILNVSDLESWMHTVKFTGITLKIQISLLPPFLLLAIRFFAV